MQHIVLVPRVPDQFVARSGAERAEIDDGMGIRGGDVNDFSYPDAGHRDFCTQDRQRAIPAAHVQRDCRFQISGRHLFHAAQCTAGSPGATGFAPGRGFRENAGIAGTESPA